jgi:sec-independent protein translocase protein TatA
MFGGLHWFELLPLVLLALLFFGPKRLPEMGSAIGKTIKEFQKSMREVTSPEQPTTPAVSPSAQIAKPELTAPTTNGATTASGAASETAPESAAS